MAIRPNGAAFLSDALRRISWQHGHGRALCRQSISALVWEALVKVLANPIILRAAVVLFCSTFAFLFALIMMRLLRKSITEEAEISSEGSPTLETLPLHVFNTVIHQLKQQQQDDKSQAQAE